MVRIMVSAVSFCNSVRCLQFQLKSLCGKGKLINLLFIKIKIN